jgi:hypothetical protein
VHVCRFGAVPVLIDARGRIGRIAREQFLDRRGKGDPGRVEPERRRSRGLPRIKVDGGYLVVVSFA